MTSVFAARAAAPSKLTQAEAAPQAAPAPTRTTPPPGHAPLLHTDSPLHVWALPLVRRQLRPLLVTEGLQQLRVVQLLRPRSRWPGRLGPRGGSLLRLQEGIQLLGPAVGPHHLMGVHPLARFCGAAGGLDLSGSRDRQPRQQRLQTQQQQNRSVRELLPPPHPLRDGEPADPVPG